MGLLSQPPPADQTKGGGQIVANSLKLYNSAGQIVSGHESPTPNSVDANKIRIAKTANRRGPVGLTAGPQIAAREPAKHSRTSGIPTFSLQCIKNLFHGVCHGCRLLQ